MSPRIALAQSFAYEAESGDHGFNPIHTDSCILSLIFAKCRDLIRSDLVSALRSGCGEDSKEN